MPRHAAATTKHYSVGDVLFAGPFTIQRLGHFGFNVEDTDAYKGVSSGLLGLTQNLVAKPGVQRR